MKITSFFLPVFLFVFFGLSYSQTLEKSEAVKIIPGSKVIVQDSKTKSIKYVLLDDNYFYSASNPSEWLHKSLKATENHSFKAIKKEADKKNFTHTKYQVFYKNIPVEGHVYIVHSLNGRIHSANGEFKLHEDISVKPVLTEPLAYEKALGYVKAQKYMWESENNGRPVGELTLLSLEDKYLLTYKFDIHAIEPLSRQYIFVDASTGEIAKSTNRIHIYDATGTAKTMYNGNVTITTDYNNSYYRLREVGRGNGIETYNLNNGTNYGNASDFVDDDNNWTDTINYNHAANDAHYAAEATYDYFFSNFGRNSFDNNGAKILSYVHYSNNFANAFWDGTRMTYGDGDGIECLPLTPIEVVTHEISHAVTEHSANLEYSNESGALNESFSDIFGITVDFIKNPSTANYLMGDVMSVSHTPFRSMESPNDFGDPDTYMGLYWKTGIEDNGGVHSNSAVQNFWFYLLSEGGNGTNDLGNSYLVNGIGREKAAMIAYRNLTVYLTQFSNYADARLYSIQSAIDLFGDCSNEVAAVTDAWHAVGVGSPYTNKIIASFSTSKIIACAVPATVCFYNHSSRAISYIWDFGDGSFDTTKNPVHTYNSAGNYTAKLISFGTALCNSKDSVEKLIQVSNDVSPALAACIPLTLNQSSGGIYEFRFNTIHKITDGSSDNYQDYSCSDSTKVTEGKLYHIYIKVGSTNPENVYIWGDLNNNGSFNDPGEMLFTKKNVNKSCTDSILIPGGALYNTPLRLRVASDYASNTMDSACSNTLNGQVEDYTFYVQQNNSAPVSLFTSDKKNAISGDTLKFYDKSLNIPTTWAWSFPDGNPSSSTLQNPVVVYDTPGTYDVTLIVTNKNGTDTVIYSGYINVTTPAPSNLSARIKNKLTGEVALKWSRFEETNINEDFEDDIADNFVFSDNSFSVQNGQLKCTGLTSGWKSALYDAEFSDFTIEYKYQQTSGTPTGVGIFLRSDGFFNQLNSNGYLIVMDYEYGVWKFINGSYVNIIPWKVSTAINTTPGSSNVATIQAIGSNFKIFVNGIFVDEFNDNSFSSGKTNLTCYLNSSTNVISWDYMSILLNSNPIETTNIPKAENYIVKGRVTPFESPVTYSNIKSVPVAGLVQDIEKSNVFKYFNVFRDGALLTKTTNPYYTDTLPTYGTYNYQVTSKYDSIETKSTNTATINWAVPNPGDFCENAQNLASLANPYSGSTFGYMSDFTLCSMGYAPDRIFYIDVPAKNALNIGQTFNDFNSVYSIRVGGSCPGTTEIACADEPDIQTHKYINTSDSVQRVYFIISGVGSSYGNFTISWKRETPVKPTPDFTASKTFFAPGTLVNFTDNSKGVPITWKWSFPGGTPSSSTLQNPSVFYNTAGEYDVKLTIANKLGEDSITKTGYITVTNLIYCTSNLGGGGCPSDITKLSIKGTTLNNNNHTICSTLNSSTYGSYPFEGVTTATLESDTTYELSVTTSKSDNISVWIDYNQNGIFEPTEWNQISAQSTPNVASLAYIAIPSNAKNGKTGMRIRSNNYWNSNGANDACSYFVNGITEDYYITLLNIPKKPIAKFSGKREAMVGENVQFTDLSSGAPTTWQWYFTGGTPASSNLQNPIIKYNSAGIYSVKLVVKNALGADSITKTDYISVTTSLPGEDCSSAQNLANLTSPYAGTTISYRKDFSTCGNFTAPDRIFYIDVPSGNILNIGWTYTNYDGMHSIRVGGSCPGTNEIICTDSDIQTHTYTNSSGATERVYFIAAGWNSYSGNFTLAWELLKPSIPVADFVVNDTSILIGSYVYFTDYTTGMPTSWNWSFQGGSPSSSSYQNPSVYYNTPGTYDVMLIASNSLGTDTIIKTKYIKVTLPPKPAANFYAYSTNITAGSYAEFYDNSSNNPTSRKWTFDGGSPSTSTYSNPSVRYNTPGIYSVKLVVSNAGGSDSLIRTNYIIVTAPPKPVANFYANSTNIIVGSATYFYDNSTNNPTSRRWTFSGGSPAASTSSNPYVYYNTPGTYDVKLVVKNAGGADSITKAGYITVTAPPKPVVNFYASYTNIIAGNSTDFYDNSLNNPTSWKWTFNGGSPSSSTSSNPYVIYNLPGTYDVKLVATNQGGTDSITKIGYITVTLPPKPIANFSPASSNILVGSYVNFYDNSSNSPTSRSWTFTGGSPSTSTSSSPYVYYNTPGTYTVKLIVSNAGGSDSIVRTNCVTVTMPSKPIANFSSSTTNTTAGTSINFYDYSTNNPTSYQWTFTGGSPSSSAYSSPTVVYNTPGTYTVKLVVSNAGGSDTLTRTGYITITPAPKPVANFYASTTTTTVGSYVSFNDISSNNPTSWKWSFPGGSPSTYNGKYPGSISYNALGTYTVKLVVSNSSGSDSLIRTGYITVTLPPKPVADFYYTGSGSSIGSYFYFYNNSTNNATSWKWSFPGGTPSTSTSSSPVVTYNNYGEYDVKLVASNAGGSDSIVKTGLIKISRYCITDLGGSGSCPGDINAVSITGTALNNTLHDKCNTSNSSTHASYPASGNTTASLKMGKTYELSVTTNRSDIISVWIDYNQNNVFESTEWKQVTTSSTANIPSKVIIAVPSNAVKGSTGMRIRTRNAGSSNSSTYACSYFTSGITEDYTVTIIDSTKDFKADTTLICNNGTVTFTNISTATVNSYSWRFGSGSSPSYANTEGPHTVTYRTPGYKTVTLTINGSDSITKMNYINVKPLPPTPIITQNKNNLISNASLGNQWYLLGSGAINGAVSNIFAPASNGNYYVIVTDAGCTSLASNMIYFLADGLNQLPDGNQINIFPNPTMNILNIKTEGNIYINDIEVRTIVGNLALKFSPESKQDNIYKIDLSGLSAGSYIISLHTDKGIYKYKVLKIN